MVHPGPLTHYLLGSPPPPLGPCELLPILPVTSLVSREEMCLMLGPSQELRVSTCKMRTLSSHRGEAVFQSLGAAVTKHHGVGA